MKRKTGKRILFAIVYAAAFAVNVGHFAWSWDVKAWHAAITAVYAAVCVWFLFSERTDRTHMRLEMIAGALTAVTGIVALLIRASGFSFLTVPGVLLAGVFVTPLYGLRGLIPDYDAVYAVIILLGAVWFAAALRFFRKTEEKGETSCNLP